MSTQESSNISKFSEQDVRYLRLLSKSFPSIAAASTEIINLEAILTKRGVDKEDDGEAAIRKSDILFG